MQPPTDQIMQQPHYATGNASHAAAQAAANGPDHATAYYPTANATHAAAHTAIYVAAHTDQIMQ